MNAYTERSRWQTAFASLGYELYRPGKSQLHYLVNDPDHLLQMCAFLAADNAYLISAFANDERELEDSCFKQYAVFSHASADLFLTIEFPLGAAGQIYPSMYEIFPAVDPFEREIADLFGLIPNGREGTFHTHLHPCYADGIHPLRRGPAYWKSTGIPANQDGRHALLQALPPEGQVFIPVGPVHAGVIEPGHFRFTVSGETINGLDILLGYTHKGIEFLFQNRYSLIDGWRLAERVSGDSSFAHSLAYSKAVEVLSNKAISEETSILRGLLLELERLANHLGDCSMLAHDVALDMVASEMAVLREEILRLNGRISGNRFLRGINRPGGIVLPRPLDSGDIRKTVSSAAVRFLASARWLAEFTGFRNRTIGIGVLSKNQAASIGVTGMTARGSGLERDFCQQHPFGPYNETRSRAVLAGRGWKLDLPYILHQEMNGDVFCRFLVRVTEATRSAELIYHFLDLLEQGGSQNFYYRLDFTGTPNFEFGIGYVEGWRGDIFYWVMKDKFDRIYRCKVRDPSTLNWPGLKAAVEPHEVNGRWLETSLVDFPIINKSFNLSYSGNDL